LAVMVNDLCRGRRGLIVMVLFRKSRSTRTKRSSERSGGFFSFFGSVKKYVVEKMTWLRCHVTIKMYKAGRYFLANLRRYANE